MALSDAQKKQLARLASADYGVPNFGNDSLRETINVGPSPGISSHVDFFDITRQIANLAANEPRLDDGFRGLRMAKLLHVEIREFASCPDKFMVKELLEEVAEGDSRPEDLMNEIYVFYAIPYGGVSAMNVLPNSLMGMPGETTDTAFDYEKILNFPRFYALGTAFSDGQEIPVPGDFIEVEIKDYTEYSFGVFKRKTGSSYMISGGEFTPGVASKDGPGTGGNFGAPVGQDFGPGGKFVDTGAKIPYNIESYNLDNRGGYIGLTNGKDESLFTDPVPDEMAAVNGGMSGKSKYRALEQKFRTDIAEYMHRAIAEVRDMGGRYYGCGSFMQPEWKISWERMRTKGCIKGLHHTGRAFDLHTAAGCMLDSKAINSLRRSNWNASSTPAYHYYVSPNGPKRWSVYFQSEDPTVPERQILAFFASWSGGGEIFCEKVTGRFVDMTAIMAKHGFRVIPAHSGLTPMDDVEKECMGPNGSAALSEGGKKSRFTTKWSSAYSHLEWWHFQFTGDLTKRKSTYGTQLTAVSTLDYIKKRWGTPGRVAWWSHARQRRLTWDSPEATYLYAWG